MSATIRQLVRVSTGRQAEEGHSLDQQEHRGADYAKREEKTHVVYREEGVSGASKRRPKRDRLLADLQPGDVVLVTSLDRLGRSTRDLLETFDLIEAKGATLVSLREAIDTSTAAGRLLRTILAAVAEFERELGRERTANGIAGRARSSGKPWGAPAYGYRKTADGHWEPDPGERDVFVRIFRERVERGMSKNGIAAALTRDGVPTRKGARAWSASVVGRILSGREGLGEFHHGGEWRRGQHEPLIDENTWRAAQKMDEQGRRYAPGARGRLPKRHLFVRGALRCVCGDAMLPRTSQDSADVYVCRSHKADSSRCPLPPLRRDVIDGHALAMFEDASLDLDATRRQVETQLSAQVAEVGAQLERAEREASLAIERYRRVQRDYQNGVIDGADWAEQRPDLIAERDAATAEVERLRAQAENTARGLANIDAESETLRRWAELRAAVAGLISGTGTDVKAFRAAFASVFDEVRLRDQAWVRDRISEDVDAMVRGEMPEGPVLFGRVGEYVMDFYGSWERVAVGFDVPSNIGVGSGVPL
ncbi:MAG TPA: recombinase family protein [Solirubrobacter sp.]|nr:recombinase family protein [Solirubrobacter sp.]